MDMHIQSEFECVYYINGEFFERADSVKMNEFDMVYITALPLRCDLLPYTVRLCGATPTSCELFTGLRLESDHYLLLLRPRYVTVYERAASPHSPPKSEIARLFDLVKSGNDSAATGMLTDELKKSVDSSALRAFFAAYERIAECQWPGQTKNRFYLIDETGRPVPHVYVIKDGKIDDIKEE